MARREGLVKLEMGDEDEDDDEAGRKAGGVSAFPLVASFTRAGSVH